MKQLIEFPLDNNETILVEVDISEENKYGERKVSRKGDLIKQATLNFKDSLLKIEPVAETIIGRLTRLSKHPEEIEVDFGIKMNAEAGAIIASSGIEANFEIKLKWKWEKNNDNAAEKRHGKDSDI